MKKNEWMSDFYGIPWLEVEGTDDPVDEIKNSLLEWRVDVRDIPSFSAAQEKGFDLVETGIMFESKIQGVPKDFSGITEASEDDLNDILEITHQCMTLNDKVYTRFKNTKYFSVDQCDEYYRLSVVNNFSKDETITVVSRDDQGVAGFYMIREVEKDVYKGVMTGVLPRARGKMLHIKMQQFSFGIMNRKVTIINATQLNNFNVIKNHMIERRNLSKIEHIFYLKT